MFGSKKVSDETFKKLLSLFELMKSEIVVINKEIEMLKVKWRTKTGLLKEKEAASEAFDDGLNELRT